MLSMHDSCVIFFFNDTATTVIDTYLHTLSLHDALPIYVRRGELLGRDLARGQQIARTGDGETGEIAHHSTRSEEHTSELQSLMRISYAVFCLKKKTYNSRHAYISLTLILP